MALLQLCFVLRQWSPSYKGMTRQSFHAGTYSYNHRMDLNGNFPCRGQNQDLKTKETVNKILLKYKKYHTYQVELEDIIPV